MSTILLVEDDPDIRHLVAYRLTRSGFEVVEAADGHAGLRAAADRQPDLAILDVRMPRMSGIEVCRELRARTPGLPILMLTARARAQDLEQAYAAGATDYVVKPFSPRALVERVESALQRVSR